MAAPRVHIFSGGWDSFPPTSLPQRGSSSHRYPRKGMVMHLDRLGWDIGVHYKGSWRHGLEADLVVELGV